MADDSAGISQYNHIPTLEEEEGSSACYLAATGCHTASRRVGKQIINVVFHRSLTELFKDTLPDFIIVPSRADIY